MAQDTSAADDPIARVTSLVRSSVPDTHMLAHLVGEAPTGTETAAYIPPTWALRTEARETIHLRAVADIARLRFAYPTEKYRDYKAYTNHPQRAMGIQMESGKIAYPDIVVVQHPENNAKIVAQIETNETVRESVARSEWLPYAELAPLYLYVPVGKGGEAADLCAQLDIPVVGIRTWRYLAGNDDPEITNHK